MKADGSIIIDTKIVDGGMEKGFELIKDEMSSVGITAKKVGEQIEISFSKMDVSKPIANAVAKVEQLEHQLAAATADFETALAADDDKGAARMAARRIAVYDRLEAAREKLSIELAAAVRKEAEAEEKATQKKMRAAEREAAEKQKIAQKQFRDLTKPARRFNSRLREIVSGALVFNLLSAGLREMTSYFGSALKANTEFSASFAQLKGALLTAFQPIYEVVLPALLYLMRVLTALVQVAGAFFAAITGRNTAQMAENAKALNKQANAIGGVGDAAEEAAKQLAGFDEINRLESTSAFTAGGGGGGAGDILPNFEPIEITKDLERILALVGAIGAGLLAWRLASMFTDSLSTAAGLGIAVGSALLYAYNWADAFANGISWKNLFGLLLSAAGVVAGLAIAFGSAGAAVALLITGVGLVVLALHEWITTGELTNEACAALVIGIMAIGAAIAIFTGSWIPLLVAGVASAVVLIAKNWDAIVEGAKAMLADIQAYLSETFADGFLLGLARMLQDALAALWNFFVEFANSVIENWNNIWGSISSYQTSGTIPSASASVAAYSAVPDVPHLAKGAVIPPNQKFMAVLGDQTHGNNLETPEDLLRQIVREEAGGGDDRLIQLMQTLISVVEGIQVGDETIGRAAARYNRSASRARGY